MKIKSPHKKKIKDFQKRLRYSFLHFTVNLINLSVKKGFCVNFFNLLSWKCICHSSIYIDDVSCRFI
jgi:hypothetical protein